MKFIIDVYAFFSIIPFVPFLIFYFILIFLKYSKKTALDWSVYLTSIFLFGAVSGIIRALFAVNGFWISLLWVILLACILLFLQWKVKGNLDPVKIFSSTVKLSFITFAVFYLLFFAAGLFVI